MNWTKRKTSAWIAASLGAVAAAAIIVEAFFTPRLQHVQFEGEGLVLHTIITDTGNRSRSNYFKVIVRDFEWRIIIQEHLGFTEASYDGNELINIHRGKNQSNEQIGKGGVAGMNSEQAEIQYFPVPNFGLDRGMLSVWFAYASQCYLDNAHPGYLSPLNGYNPILLSMGYEQEAQLTRQPAPPGLPERAVIFDDGRFTGFSGVARPSPFNQGFTNTVFQTLAFTNLAGMDIPLHSTIFHFAPKLGGASTNAIYCWYHEDIYLTNLSSTISITHFRPESTNGVFSVEDHRFNGQRSIFRPVVQFMAKKLNPALTERLFGNDAHDIPTVFYATTNSVWPTTRQVRQMPDFKVYAAEAPRLAPLPGQTNANVYYHPLNFPHSLRTRPYPNTYLLVCSITVFTLACSFLLRLGVRQSK
jgi:hypothetical protein